MVDGHVLQQVDIDNDFAEGIAVVGSSIYQLSWKSGLIRVFDGDDLRLRRTHVCPGEGWGMTTWNGDLLISNGTHVLYRRQAADLRCLQRIGVWSYSLPVRWINDIEYTNGVVLANIWKWPEIAIIAPQTGRVQALVDCRSLVEEAGASGDPECVLNGIAFDRERGTVFITGKNWPLLFEVDIRLPGNQTRLGAGV
jgi:glutamine cyclotransferase